MDDYIVSANLDPSTKCITQPSFYVMRIKRLRWHSIWLKPDREWIFWRVYVKNLARGAISRMRPFGKSLQYSLENARIDTEDSNFALWVEEDYCSPPLAMEREAVLNQYFNDIIVEKVESEKEAWSRLKDKTRLMHDGQADRKIMVIYSRICCTHNKQRKLKKTPNPL